MSLFRAGVGFPKCITFWTVTPVSGCRQQFHRRPCVNTSPARRKRGCNFGTWPYEIDISTSVNSEAILRKFLFVLLCLLPLAAAQAQQAKPIVARNVVLVHGAWADGSSWSDVIARLQAAGMHVTAVQNPLTSLADSVAATKRALALQDGPTVLAGHSWSGTVISQVGGDPKVSALVYVAARAPDAGEDFVALSAKYPTMPVRAGVENHDEFTTVKEQPFLDYFANGVPHDKAKILYAVQEPTAASLFNDRTSEAAWHTKPTFYAVSKQDMTISPDLERFLAKRMHATTIELDAGHLSLVSHSKEIADLILRAAGRKP